MNLVLHEWNEANELSAHSIMLACCGAQRWARSMVRQRPISDEAALHELADRTWHTMNEADWMEAFACHPRIGHRTDAHASSQSAAWSLQEQSAAQSAPDSVLTRLAEGNSLYEARFGFTYIVCASGRSAEEMLSILERRLAADRASELREAAEQQRHILHIRLGKWLSS